MTRILYSKIRQVIYIQADPTTSVQGIRDSLPSNLAELSKRVKVAQYSDDKELIAIARELYQIGEELWTTEYAL